MQIDWADLMPAFSPDGRGNTLEKWHIEKNGSARWLYLCGPSDVVQQIEQYAGGLCVRAALPKEAKSEFNYVLHFPNGFPSGLKDFVGLLCGPIFIPCGGEISLMTALDWYKIPEDGVDPKQWKDTPLGSRVHVGKYYSASPSRRNARSDLRQALTDFILAHPMYAEATSVVAAPGHNADGQGFGELLAEAVASDVGMNFQSAISTIGARPERKGAGAVPISIGTFEFRDALSDRVIVIDDVYGSGETMRATAHAAKQAGASEVFGLTAVRRMRK
jgi:hypothetical protein